MIKYCFFIVVVILLEKSNAGGGAPSGETTKNITGIDCYNNTNPQSEDDCFPYFDKTYSCCFAKIKYSNKNITSCVKIKTEYDFIGSRLTKLQYNGTYYNASVICESDAHSQRNCGVWTPKNLEDCRLDGSKTTSCCMFNDQNNTKTCLLSSKKIGLSDPYFFNNSAVTCHSCLFSISFFNFLILTILLI